MQKILFIGASGMLGKPVAQELIRAGFNLTLLGRDREKLNKLFAPIGVPINSQTPEEIAISIAAEIISVKNKK